MVNFLLYEFCLNFAKKRINIEVDKPQIVCVLFYIYVIPRKQVTF